MALTDSDLSDLLAALKAGEMTDTIRSSLEWVLQQLIEAEATAFIGAGPHERTEGRVTQRNGHRPRLLSTKAGDLELKIPKLREGSFFPSLLERRRRIDGRTLQALSQRPIGRHRARGASPGCCERPRRVLRFSEPRVHDIPVGCRAT